MKVARRLVASRTDESAELRRRLDLAYADIALVNKWLDEAQGMFQKTHSNRSLMLGPYMYILM